MVPDLGGHLEEGFLLPLFGAWEPSHISSRVSPAASPRRSQGSRFTASKRRTSARVVNFAGGIPLMRGDEVAGAIGVSGGTVDQDQEVAEAGGAAF
jgi:uncharacterized protein GlcG (DUF336 family)